MARGDVFFHPNFQFNDGEFGRKRIVQLNDPEGDEHLLFGKTTSQVDPDRYTPGCCNDQLAHFLPEKQEACFEKHTLVEFYDIFHFEQAEFLGLTTRIVSHRGRLSDECIAELIHCIRCHEYDVDADDFVLITREM